MARFTSGWVKSYRSALDSDLYDNPILAALWEALQKMAIRFERKIIWNGKQKLLVPGTAVFGIKEFADRWDVSRKTIHKWIHYLDHTQRITLETGTHGCIATICNWEKYQGGEDEGVTPREHGGNTEVTRGKRQVALNREVQEVENIRSKEKEGAKKVSRKSVSGEMVNQFIARYCEVMKERYGDNPIITNTELGIARKLIQATGLPKALTLVEDYLKNEDKRFKATNHSLTTLNYNLNVVSVRSKKFMPLSPELSAQLSGKTDQQKQDEKFSYKPDELKKLIKEAAKPMPGGDGPKGAA